MKGLQVSSQPTTKRRREPQVRSTAEIPSPRSLVRRTIRIALARSTVENRTTATVKVLLTTARSTADKYAANHGPAPVGLRGHRVYWAKDAKSARISSARSVSP